MSYIERNIEDFATNPKYKSLRKVLPENITCESIKGIYIYDFKEAIENASFEGYRFVNVHPGNDLSEAFLVGFYDWLSYGGTPAGVLKLVNRAVTALTETTYSRLQTEEEMIASLKAEPTLLDKINEKLVMSKHAYKGDRINANVIEEIIKTFPPQWNFNFKDLLVLNHNKEQGLYILGDHEFGSLTFRVCRVKIQPHPGFEAKDKIIVTQID